MNQLIMPLRISPKLTLIPLYEKSTTHFAFLFRSALRQV